MSLSDVAIAGFFHILYSIIDVMARRRKRKEEERLRVVRDVMES